MDVPTILGLVATAGLTLFYIPQLWTAYRAPVMTGFNIPAWIALLVAVLALIAQGTMLGVWTLVSANAVAAGALLIIIAQIIRKRGPQPVIRSIPPRPPRPAWLPGDPVVDVCPLCEVARQTWRDPAACETFTRAPLAREGQSYRVCAACNTNFAADDTDDEGTLACGLCGELYAAACWSPGDPCDECEDGVLRAPEAS